MSMLYIITNPIPRCSLRVCRGCLATDARLYDMQQNNLIEPYCALLNTNDVAWRRVAQNRKQWKLLEEAFAKRHTELPLLSMINLTNDLPKYLCNYCTALLLKYYAFRSKCLDTMSCLKNPQLHNVDLTLDQIKQINKPPLLTQSYVLNINIDPVQQVYTDDLHDPIKVEIYDTNDMSDENDSILGKTLLDNTNKVDKPVLKRKVETIVPDKPMYIDLKSESVDIVSDSESNNVVNDYDIQSNDGISYISVEGHLSEEFDISDLEFTSNIDVLSDETNSDEKKQNTERQIDSKQVDPKEVFKDCKSSDTAILNTILNLAANGKRIRMNDDTKKKILNLNSLGVIDVDELKINFDKELETDYSEDITKNLSKKFLDRKDVQIILKCKEILKNNRNVRKTRESKMDKGDLRKMYNTEVLELSKEEQLKDIEKRKESKNYLLANIKCELCFKGFMSDVTYKKHMMMHDDIRGKHVCDICHIHHNTLKRLHRHKYNHKWKFICKECGQVVKSSTQAKDHFKWHGGARFKCKYCGKEFNRRSSYCGHIKLSHPDIDKMMRCEMCGDCFSGEYGLNCHEQRAHLEMKSPQCYCSGCNTQFYCSDAFKAHQGADGLCITTHKYCVRCGMSFETEQLLKEHEIEQRKTPNEYKCVECNKTFKNHQYYIGHMTTTVAHGKSRPGSFQQKKNNKSRKPQYKSVFCELCGKTYKNKTVLKLHQDFKHSNDRPFPCNLCKKTFKNPTNLRHHSRVHTGERPYECDICEKKFALNANLKKHKLQIHANSDERPFSCDICEKRFAFKSDVQTHIKMVHMKMPAPPRTRRMKKT